jgi:hypothetical protein
MKFLLDTLFFFMADLLFKIIRFPLKGVSLKATMTKKKADIIDLCQVFVFFDNAWKILF